MRNRAGFTTIEMAIVTTVVGLVTALAIPRLASVREQAGLNGAKRHVITQLAGARSSAIQRGAAVTLVAAGHSMYLTTPIDGTDTQISPRSLLLPTFGVEMTATVPTISFDARGFATTLPPEGATFVLSRGAASDSVCVTRLGLVLPECGL